MRQIIIGIFLVFNLATVAQLHRPPVTNFTPDDYGNLQTPINYCVFQDSRGFIYAGNSGGVLIFDGQHWQLTEVEQGSFVNNISQSPDGKIYVATSSGEFGYLSDGGSGKLKFVSKKNSFKRKKIELDYIERMHCTSKGVYIQTRNELFLFKNDEIKKIPTKTSYHLIFCVNDKIYARERKVGLIEINNTNKKILSSIEEFREYGVFGVCKMGSKKLFIATQEKGLWTLDLTNNQTQYLNCDSTDLKNYMVYGAIQLHDGNYALNTLNSGVLIVNQNGEKISTINKSSGIRVNDVKHLIEDKHHNLWLALSNGISLVNNSSFLSFYNDKSGLPGSMECAIRFKNKLYVGTSEGLYVENGSNEEKQFTAIGNVNSHVWDIKCSGSKIAAATDAGLFIGDESGFRQQTFSLVNTLTFLENGNQLLVASPEKILIIEPSSGRQLALTEIYDEFPRCLAIQMDPTSNNTIAWMGTIEKGVVRIEWKDNKLNYELFDNLNDKDIIFTKPVILNNKVYICTAHGLRKIEYEKDGTPFFNFSGLNNELDNIRIADMAQAGKRIWVCADNQVLFIDEKGKIERTPFKPIQIGQIFNLFAENDKTCWISAADGLVKYHETYTKKYNQQYDLTLRNVKINGDSLIFYGNWFNRDLLTNQQGTNDEFNLSYQFNTLEFEVSALYFKDIGQITYSHFLEGNDADWSAWSDEHKIKYSNLREGTYTLKVKAKNVYGYESSTLRFTFTIQPPWYRTTAAYIAYFLLAVIVFIISNRILSYRLKQKNIQLESLVQKRTKEIAQKNEELHERNIQITLQKQEITDSINYAQKIQEAMLPAMQEMRKNLSDSFILFKPKDIVSGDFYWVGNIDHHLIMICADCTGHGVPGAFMSMLCIDKLNAIIQEKKIIRPDKILEEANRGIKKSLGQSDEQNLRTKDGMDAAVIVIDLKNSILHYSGANRPLWKVTNNEIVEIKPDKYAVGGFTREDQEFSLHQMAIKKGERFYTSTDGYADQFGGPAGKKIMVRNFKQLILDNQSLNFEEQKELLDEFVENWKHQFKSGGEEQEQVDDICVMGFEV